MDAGVVRVVATGEEDIGIRVARIEKRICETDGGTFEGTRNVERVGVTLAVEVAVLALASGDVAGNIHCAGNRELRIGLVVDASHAVSARGDVIGDGNVLHGRANGASAIVPAHQYTGGIGGCIFRDGRAVHGELCPVIENRYAAALFCGAAGNRRLSNGGMDGGADTEEENAAAVVGGLAVRNGTAVDPKARSRRVCRGDGRLFLLRGVGWCRLELVHARHHGTVADGLSIEVSLPISGDTAAHVGGRAATDGAAVHDESAVNITIVAMGIHGI